MTIHQYNTEWWRPANLPRVVTRFLRLLNQLPDNAVIGLSPVIPFFLVINSRVSVLEAWLLTSLPIIAHHYANRDESLDFAPGEDALQEKCDDSKVQEFHAKVQRAWESNVRERLLADTRNSRIYAALLDRMNRIPNVIGFTTGMGEQHALRDISESVREAGLTADCELAHVLYAYAMGWTAAPLPGTKHGSFSRRKAIRVLKQFPEWPDGWEEQLSRASVPPRPRPVEDQQNDGIGVAQCIVLIALIVPLYLRFWIEDFFGIDLSD